MLIVLAFYAPVFAANGTIFVPTSWCAVAGSPAIVNPNIPIWPLSTTISSTTDDVLWARHERLTENTYLLDRHFDNSQIGPQGETANISFRSAVTATLNINFPTVADSDPFIGQLGDVRGEWPVQSLTELHDTGKKCIDSWKLLDPNNNNQVYGIPVVNVRRFVAAWSSDRSSGII